jgi:hypothetical protein
MSLYRNSFRKATGPIPPPGFDPKACPILATHWFGLEPQDVPEVYWNLARQGHRLPADSNVILLDGGAS